jgi:uncharacterized protein (DUF2164 family)
MIVLQLKFPHEQKEQVIANIQGYFDDERAEELGHLAAESLLEFMIKEIGPLIYNQAISDSRDLIIEKMASIEEDLYVLEKPVDINNRNVR